MKKKLLSIVLALIFILSVIPAGAKSAAENITVYISVSKYGKIVSNKNDVAMAYLPVNLSGKSSYNLDDVFMAAHEEYYTDGAEGYASEEGDWGLAVEKLWGDESGNFGYQINGGERAVSGLGETVESGDYIDVCIYQNLYPDTEGYAKFDINEKNIFLGDTAELMLSYVTGYDESWNMVFSPCENATITVNGEETEIKTDESGKAVIMPEAAGVYIISATMEKEVNESTVPAITAPVCVLTVKSPEFELLHNIAAQYKNINPEEAGGNLPWIIADMAIYEEIFPDSENIFTDEQKNLMLSEIADGVASLEKAGDIAKSILALRALGYDAKSVYTKDFEKVDIVSKLTSKIDGEESDVTNIYTLPYVIIALCQDSSYATDSQMEYLISAAIESKNAWYDTTYGTDSMTPMILALAPYYNENDTVKAIIDETVTVVKSFQRDDGLLDGPQGYESASTGLALCALSAIGIDASSVTNGGKNLIEGLVSTANEQLNAFPNAFATEQGFRGLLAWQLLLKNNGRIYNFSNYPLNEANVSGVEFLPVIFNVTPENATITVNGGKKISENCFDVGEGSFSYKVSASGYSTQSGTIEVTADEVLEKAPKIIEVELERKVYSGGGGGGGMVSTGANDKEDEKKDEEEIKQDDKETSDKENDKTEEEKPVFTDKTFSDINADDWYYMAVKYAYENNLFSGTGNGFEPNIPMSRAMLVTVLHRMIPGEKVAEKAPFADVASGMWYSESVNWAYENKIVTGMTENSFMPDENVTREQLALIIYNFAKFAGYDVSVGDDENIAKFSDSEQVSDWAVEAIKYLVATGVINGKDNKNLAPKDGTTRAEVATMIMRFAEMEK